MSMAIITVGFTLLRFLHLDGDFPTDLDWSGDLYTDEGWYADAATRYATGRPWFIAGDFNPAVNMPLGQLLHSVFFSLFGLNLFAARLPDVCAFALTVACTVRMVRPSFGSGTAWLVALIFSLNFAGFAFSRIAFMETIGVAFVALAMMLALRAVARKSIFWLAVASSIAGLACLVKTSMLFGLIVLASIAWGSRGEGRSRLLRLVAAILPGVAVLLAWQAWAESSHEADFRYFIDLNIRDRMVSGAEEWLHDLPMQLNNVLNLGDGFVFSALLLVVGALVISNSFRRNLLVRGVAVYFVTYFAMLSLVKYGPPRYFVVLLWPLAALSAIACREWMSWFIERKAPHRAAYPALLLAVVLFFESKSVLLDLARPRYSMTLWAKEAGQIIRQREGHLIGVPVIGSTADTLAMMTGVSAINNDLGLAPMRERLSRRRPRYAVLLGEDAVLLDQLRKNGAIPTHIQSWNVYGNYLFNSPRMEFWAIDWKAPAALEEVPVR